MPRNHFIQTCMLIHHSSFPDSFIVLFVRLKAIQTSRTQPRQKIKSVNPPKRSTQHARLSDSLMRPFKKDFLRSSSTPHLRSDASSLRVHERTLRGGAAAGRRGRRRRRPGRPRLGAPGERRTERSGADRGRGLSASMATVAFAEQSGRGRTPWEYAQGSGHETRMAPVLRPVPWPCLSRVMGSQEEREG